MGRGAPVTNLAALLMDHAFGDDEALLHTIDRSVTAGRAKAEAAAFAERLEIAPGQAVAVQLPNGPELVWTMAAVWLAGGVYVPVNPRVPPAEVAAVLASTRPAAFVSAGGIAAQEDADRYADDVAFVMWTSGTTGRPKAIQHTHTAYVELLDRVLGPLRGRPAGDAAPSLSPSPSPNLIPVSMALNAGLYNVLFGLRAGAALVIMDGFDAEQFGDLVRRFSIRSTVLPPAAIAMLVDSTVTDLSPLKYVRSITAPLSPLHARRFTEKYSVFVLNGYGQAEIGEVIGWTAQDARQFPDKIGAAGRPHPGVDVRIGAQGQLLVRPPNTASGIDERRDAQGFIDTGDIAHQDDDGFVWIDGRAGDVINRGGNKVFPEAVEEVLRLNDAVDDVAVVGLTDDRLGHVPIAVLVGRPVPDDDLRVLCRDHLVAYKVPLSFHWVDALPRNEAGKVLRHQLAERFDSGSASGTGNVSNSA